jgi:hypothetical protein
MLLLLLEPVLLLLVKDVVSLRQRYAHMQERKKENIQ